MPSPAHSSRVRRWSNQLSARTSFMRMMDSAHDSTVATRRLDAAAAARPSDQALRWRTFVGVPGTPDVLVEHPDGSGLPEHRQVDTLRSHVDPFRDGERWEDAA